MELKFQVHAKIKKPINEVFEAVYNPKILSKYFTTGGASGPLDKGKEVLWSFHDMEGQFPVMVKETVPHEKIIIAWDNHEGGMTETEITFEAIEDALTLVNIRESGWQQLNQAALDESYSHCEGWMQMLCCLKAYIEHGIVLRDAFY